MRNVRNLALLLIILVVCQATASSDEDVEAIFEKAIKAYKQGDYERAIDGLNMLVSSHSGHGDMAKWYYWLGVVYVEFVSKAIDEGMNSRYWELSGLSNEEFLGRYKGSKNQRSRVMEGSLLHEVAHREVMDRYSRHERYVRKVPLSFTVEYNNYHFKKVLGYENSPYVEDARFHILHSEGRWGDPKVVFGRFRRFLTQYPESKYAPRVLLLFATLADDAWEFSCDEVEGGRAHYRKLGLKLYKELLSKYPGFPGRPEAEAEYDRLLKGEFDNSVYGIYND